jgi:ubiquinone/menaquinone biosynthesis C-methylase UbiE
MAVDHLQIYRNQAAQYEQLISREDYQGNIGKTLREICDWRGKTVLDLGTGTGRLMDILLPEGAQVYGIDRSPAMLQVAREKLRKSGFRQWCVCTAVHDQLPFAENSVVRITSGWSLAYLALEQGEDETAAAFQRIEKLLRHGGRFIILETMGTGFVEPNPPDKLLPYYAFLEAAGFQFRWIRTDYKFDSVEEAEALTRFFFGDEPADAVAGKQETILP